MTKNLLVELGLEELPAYVVTPSVLAFLGRGDRLVGCIWVNSYVILAFRDLL